MFACRHSGWLNFPADISPDLPEPRPRSKIRPDAALDMEEYLHYSNPTNGGIGIIVPGRLFLIPPPHELPEGCIWLDKPAEGCSMSMGQRVFSPAFYADLLADEFSVSCLLRPTSSNSGTAYDTAPFQAREIAVEDLSGSYGGGLRGQLQGVDKLLTLVSAAQPRALAVHGAPEDCGGTGPLLALLAVVLLRRHGFPSASSAVAWLLMANPSPDATAAAAAEVSRGLEGLSLIPARSQSAQVLSACAAAAEAEATEAVWLLRRAPSDGGPGRAKRAPCGASGPAPADGGRRFARCPSADGHG